MSLEAKNRAKALAAAMIWGASFVAVKAVLAEISPLSVITFRFGLGVIVLLFAAWRLGSLRMVGGRELIALVVLGGIGVTFHQGLQVTGLTLTSASSMAWLVALNPAFTAVLAWLFLSEGYGRVKILGLVLAFAGAIVVVSKGALTTGVIHLPSTRGDLLAIISALNWSIFTVASKPMLRRLPPTLMMAWVMLIGWVLILPFWGMEQGWQDLALLSRDGWLAIGFLGVLCSGVAYLFWYDALAHIDASEVAAFIYVEPVVTVFVAAMLLSEPFTPATFLGGLTILLGVYLVNRPSAPSPIAEVPVAGD